MKKSLAVIAALAAIALASPAFAAGKAKATADNCASYAKQLDDAISTHPKAAKLDAAKKDKADGDAACAASKYADGVKSYKAGLKALHVKPVRK